MWFKPKKLAASVGCATALLGISATTASAAPSALPPGTVVTAQLKQGTSLTLDFKLDTIDIVTTCTTFSAQGAIPATGTTVTLSGPPTISGCSDDLGGVDTVKTNATDDTWALTETNPTPGVDRVLLRVPKLGATWKTSILPTCTVSGARGGDAKANGAYDGDSTVDYTNALISLVSHGCLSSLAAKMSATLVLTPAPGPKF